VHDSHYWKLVHSEGGPFRLEGENLPSSRSTSRRSTITTVEGVVERVDRGAARIAGEEPFTLRHALPSVFELAALLGRRVRVTLLQVASSEGLGVTQTLTVTGYDDGLLVVAHSGEMRGNAHRLGRLHVYAALSQRAGGPMVFGTSRLQSLVRAGNHVRVRDEDETYVMHFEARHGRAATYAIAAEELWRGPFSTVP
jgi:hypothetical protein